MTEEWRSVVGANGFYEVSDLGRLRSVDRVVCGRDGVAKRIKGGPIFPSPVPSGHLIVTLCAHGKRRSGWLHRLVAAAFLGPCPDGMEVRHLDGTPGNNRLSNLAYGTRSANAFDRVAHGADHNARKTHCKWGHPFDAANTIRNSNGSRKCRRCKSAIDRMRYARSKEN